MHPVVPIVLCYHLATKLPGPTACPAKPTSSHRSVSKTLAGPSPHGMRIANLSVHRTSPLGHPHVLVGFRHLVDLIINGIPSNSGPTACLHLCLTSCAVRITAHRSSSTTARRPAGGPPQTTASSTRPTQPTTSPPRALPHRPSPAGHSSTDPSSVSTPQQWHILQWRWVCDEEQGQGLQDALEWVEVNPAGQDDVGKHSPAGLIPIVDAKKGWDTAADAAALSCSTLNTAALYSGYAHTFRSL